MTEKLLTGMLSLNTNKQNKLLVLYFALIEIDSYTWLSTVCPANTCQDFMSMQAGLSLLWIYLSFCRFCCALAHLQLWYMIL